MHKAHRAVLLGALCVLGSAIFVGAGINQPVRHQQFIDPPWASVAALKAAYMFQEPPAAPHATAVPSRPTTYTVVKGDTLTSVASHFTVNLDNLAIANHMNLWDILLVGKVLALPDPNAPPPATALPLSPPHPAALTANRSPAPAPAPTYPANGASGWPNSCYGITNPDGLWIIARESGCNVYAHNPSGACGIGQRMDRCDGYNGYAQAQDMTSYVMSRYGSWAAAKAFWESHHWY